MRISLYLPTVIAVIALTGAHAAPPSSAAACASPAHHEFDFWIGDWTVTEHGKPAGANRISALLEGCALLENWSGAGGTRGNSLNFYDSSRRLWQQTWIDSSGSPLNLEGHFIAGHMTLSSLKAGVNDADRITWTPNKDGSVRQLWEHTMDAGKTWKVAFDGLYVRR